MGQVYLALSNPYIRTVEMRAAGGWLESALRNWPMIWIFPGDCTSPRGGYKHDKPIKAVEFDRL